MMRPGGSRQSRGMMRGQTHGPLKVPFKEESIMSRMNKGTKLIEGFEDYTKVKDAERHVDYLLDMCGVPHHRKKLEENMGSLVSMSLNGRPYDHPRKFRINPVVDIDSDEIESDMKECDAIQGEEYPGDFEGASPNNLPEEEPAKEMTPQKKQNKINTVPNQDASSLLAAIKGEMVDEMAIGSKAASQLVKKAKVLRLKYKMAGKHISMKQAARLAAR